MHVTPTLMAALPEVKTLRDCADFERTVLPFIPQLKQLPSRILHATSLVELKNVYLETNPVMSALAFSIIIAQAVFVVSQINKNYSQIDRLWSILPAFYNYHFWGWAYLHGIRSRKLDMVVVLSFIWSARLTHNYWRKGGYQKGSEDYRWAILKKYTNEFIWTIFNIVFISLIQSVLLCLVATPTYLLLLTTQTYHQGKGADIIFPVLILMAIVLETVADFQQWYFHQAKSTYQKTAKPPAGYLARDLDLGFNTLGLWSISRHPNFLGEQAVWILLYQWACFDTATVVNWTFTGAFSYLLIFQGSTPITEWISAGKYPEYKEYQKRVGKFLPMLASEGWKSYMVSKDKHVRPTRAEGKEGKKTK